MSTEPKPLLKLPADVTTRLFRLIETQIRTNDVLAGCVKTWQTWLGEPGDKLPPTIGATPWLCLTPAPSGESWFSPEAQIGILQVRIDAYVRGTCVDDVLNLWGAIRTALSPYARTAVDGGPCFGKKLTDAGAHKGVVLMTHPLVDPAPDPGGDGAFKATGMISVEYRALARS